MASSLETRNEYRSLSQTLGINFIGLGAFALSLAAATLVRFFVPDEVMGRPAARLSGAAQYGALAFVVAFLAWGAVYFRTPGNPVLSALGAMLSAGGLSALTYEILVREDFALLPGFGGLAVLLAFLCFHTAMLWRRST
jgi:hypothetical protein